MLFICHNFSQNLSLIEVVLMSVFFPNTIFESNKVLVVQKSHTTIANLTKFWIYLNCEQIIAVYFAVEV